MSWRCDAWRIAGALMLAALAACQPLPRPFQPEDKPLADLAAFEGLADKLAVFVAGIDNAPPALDDALAAALAEGLRDHGVAASDRVANPASYLLVGSARADGRDGRVVGWRLVDAGGAVVGVFDQPLAVDDAAWAEGDPALAKAIAAQAAPRLAAVIADATLAGPPAASPAPAAVRLAPVEGAPANGNAALGAAMQAALDRRGVAVVDGAEAGRPIVRGRVARRAQGAQELVEIRWTVEDADGAELGAVSQSNLVPAGSLDGDWGGIARAIAEGAADGVRALLDELAQAPR